MKKIFYLLLFCMILASSCNAFAQEDTYGEEAKIVLEAINQPFYDNDESVTRAVFAQRLMSIISFSTPSPKPYFSDVDINAEYAPALTVAYEMGIVNSNEFRPNDVITVNEAVAMLVRALGYDVYAQNEGGYPTGYMNRGAMLDLLKGIASYDKVTERISGILFLNFLNADVAELSYNGDIVIAEGKTILNTDYDIECRTGILEANDVTSVYSKGKTAQSGYVIIDGELHKAPSGLSEFIGHNLKYYYIDDDEDEKEIVGFLSYKTNILNISTEDVVSIDNGILRYEINDYGKTDKIKINTDVDLIYNGVLKEKYTNDIFLSSYGRIVFIDNDNNGDYDIAKVESYRNVVVGDIDLSDYIIYDRDGNGSVVLNPDEYDKIEIIKNDMPIDFEEIKYGDVLSIADTANDNRFIRVYVVSDVLFGSVNEKHSDGKLVINASEFKTSIFDEVSVGDYGYFCFDILGTICAFKAEIKNQYAYLIFAWQNEVDDRVSIRVCTQNGEVKDFELSEKVKIDGDMYSNHNKVYTAVNESGAALVRIDVNDDNEIYKIDTEKVNSVVTDDDFSRAFPNQVNKKYKSGNGIFGGVCGIDANTVIFAIPEDARDYDGYSIKKLSYFTNDDNYSFDGYDPNEVNILSAMVIQASENSSINDKSPIGIISSISQGINNDNEVLYKLGMATNGTQTSYFVKEDGLAQNLSVGDIIRYSLDSKSNIEAIKMLYKSNGEASGDAEISNASPSYGSFDSKYRVALGTVCRKIGDYMTVELDSGIETMKLVAKTQIYIVEDETRSLGGKSIAVGKSEDIFDSLSKPSKILVRTRYGDLSEIVVFKGVD